jgi:hypothetical protein
MTLWRANLVRRIPADSRTFIYFRRRCCAKNLVGIPQYIIAHHGWFETPTPLFTPTRTWGLTRQITGSNCAISSCTRSASGNQASRFGPA